MASDGRRSLSGEATRETLMNAATELFALRGFDGVSIEEIATKAGVNKALISYHFGGKRALYVAILRTTLSAVQTRMQALRLSDDSPDLLVREFLRTFHHMACVQRPFFPALMLRELLSSVPGAAFDQEVVPEILGVFRTMRGILERGTREGAFRPVDPFLAHIGIIGSLVFFYATEPTRRRVVEQQGIPLPLPSPEAFQAHMEEMVIRALKQDAPGARPDRSAEGDER